MSDNQSSQLDVISRLLQLEKSFRHAETIEELAYILVNDSRYLLNYRQAALWRMDNAEVFCVSGLAVVDTNVPYVFWLKRVCQQLSQSHASTVTEISANDVKEEEATDWGQWLPDHALWIPFSSFAGAAPVGLLLARGTAWTESELYLMQHVADSFSHAWQALAPRASFWRQDWYSKKRLLISLSVLLCVLLIPVRQTALAPASVIPAHPTMLRAAIDGVVDRFFIQPNDPVIKGQPLLNLDKNTLNNKLSISRKELAVAEAEYRKTAQQAMFDQESKSQVNILKSRIEQHQAEVKNMEDWLSRVEIKAPHSGVAIFSDVNDWIGRPVKLGERILMVADPDDVELEVQLPITDAINLHNGAKVLLFLNIDPINPIEATLYYAAYQAQVTADELLAYRLKASFKGAGQLPRIGLKGTAKVYGDSVPLIYYLLRKPLAVLRQWLGM